MKVFNWMRRGKHWRFHKAQWGNLTVSVMPRSLTETGEVVDSSVAIILTCAHFNEYKIQIGNQPAKCSKCGAIPGSVITKHGCKPDCDLEALAYYIPRKDAKSILGLENA